MQPSFLDILVDELSRIWWLDDLPEWIPCTDNDILRYLPTMAERRKWLRKAKAEITRRKIQERVDEIAEARGSEDQLAAEMLLEAFPKDLELHNKLTPVQRRMWLDKASLAACGRSDEMVAREPIIYFIAGGDDLIKIGHTTNLPARLRSLRTATPKELRVLLVILGTRDDEQELHRKFEVHRIGREWFSRCDAITEFISNHRMTVRADEDYVATVALKRTLRMAMAAAKRPAAMASNPSSGNKRKSFRQTSSRSYLVRPRAC
jgi:Meiotically Up-regulated Gene 113 (MUG113) protein